MRGFPYSTGGRRLLNMKYNPNNPNPEHLGFKSGYTADLYAAVLAMASCESVSLFGIDTSIIASEHSFYQVRGPPARVAG